MTYVRIETKLQARQPMIWTMMACCTQIIQNQSNFTHILQLCTIPDFEIFILIFSFCQRVVIFRLGSRMKMNLGTFYEIYVGFLKNSVTQLLSKYCLGYINLKVKIS